MATQSLVLRPYSTHSDDYQQVRLPITDTTFSIRALKLCTLCRIITPIVMRYLKDYRIDPNLTAIVVSKSRDPCIHVYLSSLKVIMGVKVKVST